MGDLRLSAEWVLPVVGPPIHRGAVLVQDGVIVSVGEDASVPAPAHCRSERFPSGVITPGLVNTHTHLELTGLGGALDASDFPAWIRALRARKSERGAGDFARAAEAGLRHAWTGGVTTVADTGDTGAAARAIDLLGGRGVAYQEVFGPHPDQVPESMEALMALVAQTRPHASDRLQIGVSPHAPYTVSGPLYRAAAAWARSEGLPLAVHIAESLEESQLVGSAAGGFAEAWRRRDIPLPEPQGLSPVAWLDRFGVLGPDTLCIHVVRADRGDIATLAERGSSVAHCPLSNAAHRHGVAPLAALQEAGIRVGLGTDSELSVGSPDLLAEARAVRARCGGSAESLLRFLTLDGARALGLGHVGALAAGLRGDVAVFDSSSGRDPSDAVLQADRATCVFIDGNERYRSNSC